MRKILETVRDTVIESFKEKQELTNSELKSLEKMFSNKLKKIWKGEITVENKFSTMDIYEYSLEVVYLLYCYPIQLIAVIQKKEENIEYWDFLLDEYPTLNFQNDIEEFYEFLRKYFK